MPKSPQTVVIQLKFDATPAIEQLQRVIEALRTLDLPGQEDVDEAT